MNHIPSPVPVGLVQWIVPDNIDMGGSDIKSVLNQNVVSCKQLCIDKSGCMAAVLNNQNGDCWLKNTLPVSSGNNIAVRLTFFCCDEGETK